MNGRQAITSSFGANRQQLGGIYIEQYGICMHRPTLKKILVRTIRRDVSK